MTAPDGKEVVGLAAAIFDVLSDLNGEVGEILSWEVLNHLDELTGDLTTTNGHELFFVNAAQLTVFGPFTSANPVDVLEFTWEAPKDDVGFVDYSTVTSDAVIWIGEQGGKPHDATPIDAIDVTEAGMHWSWNIPSPGGVAVLAGAGLWGVRRRR
jgi:hypothetical protein